LTGRPTATSTVPALAPTNGPGKCCDPRQSGHFYVQTDNAERGTTIITLKPDNDCECAVLEYAFLTEEVPRQWFGTVFNDFFEVSITAGSNRPAQIQEFVSSSDSMNGLGLGAFDITPDVASTCCYALNLNLDRNRGLPITFGISVANAGDSIFQSAVCGRVHFIKKDGSECPASK